MFYMLGYILLTAIFIKSKRIGKILIVDQWLGLLTHPIIVRMAEAFINDIKI